MRSVRWAFIGGLGLLVGACAAMDVGPVNSPLDTLPPPSPEFITDHGDDGSMVVALAFSGGGMRASAFSYGVLRALDDIVVDEEPYQRSMVDNVRVMAGVSGGAITASYFGYRGRDDYRDFDERFLYRNAEGSMLTTVSPITVSRALAGGVNDRSSFARWMDQNLYNGQTFSAFETPNAPSIWIHASDIYNRTPFLFSKDTFASLCSDINKVKIADAVAASAAVPVVFTPVVIEADKHDCQYKPPNWLTRAIERPEASIRLKAYADALSAYQNNKDLRYIHLVDGGLTDNLGITGLMLERAASQTPYGPLSAEAAVKLRHFIFIVVDAGQGKAQNWASSAQSPWLAPLVDAVIDTGITASSRHGFDALKFALDEWKGQIIKYRCGLPAAEVKRIRGTLAGWKCRDVDFTVERLSFSDFEPEMAAKLNKVETRLSLPKNQVDSMIQAGRKALMKRASIMSAARTVQVSADVSEEHLLSEN